jgi:hypothetical protein
VVATSAPASACPNGGITVTDGSGDTGYVCNGVNGSPGPSGPSGPAGSGGEYTGTVTYDDTSGTPTCSVTTTNPSAPALTASVYSGYGCYVSGFADGSTVIGTIGGFDFTGTSAPWAVVRANGTEYVLAFGQGPSSNDFSLITANWTFVVYPPGT